MEDTTTRMYRVDSIRATDADGDTPARISGLAVPFNALEARIVNALGQKDNIVFIHVKLLHNEMPQWLGVEGDSMETTREHIVPEPNGLL